MLNAYLIKLGILLSFFVTPIWSACPTNTVACKTGVAVTDPNACCSPPKMCSTPGPAGLCTGMTDSRCPATSPPEYFCRKAYPPNRHTDGSAIPAAGENQCCYFNTEMCLSNNTTANRCFPVGTGICGNQTKIVNGQNVTFALGCPSQTPFCVSIPASPPTPAGWACSQTSQKFCKFTDATHNNIKACPTGTECITFTQSGTTYDNCIPPNTQVCTYDATTNPPTLGLAPKANICCGGGSCDPRTQICDTSGTKPCCKPKTGPVMCIVPPACTPSRMTAQQLGQIL